MQKTTVFVVLLAATLASAAVSAHHSRSNFLLEEVIELEGRVTEVHWNNPHAYFEMEVSTAAGEAQTWLIEAHSLTGLKRLGWQPDSIAAGDYVLARGNPDRDSGKHFLLLDHMVKSDGSKFFGIRIPAGEQSVAAAEDRPVSPSTDFSGVWTRVGTLRDALVGGFEPPRDWPFTARAEAQVAAFDLNEDPALECLGTGVPRTILAPYRIGWIRHADRIELTRENSGLKRTIHLGSRERPAGLAPSLLGHSAGRFEADGTLVIETTGFMPTRWGLARGVDSSAGKRVVERYALTDGGLGMSVSYTLEDPEFLTGPVTVTGAYRKVADEELPVFQCDREAATRHLID